MTLMIGPSASSTLSDYFSVGERRLGSSAAGVGVVIRVGCRGKRNGSGSTDHSRGIALEDALVAFGNLGGSWKRRTRLAKGDGRLLHGYAGKGRLKAFAIGDDVIWRSRFCSI